MANCTTCTLDLTGPPFSKSTNRVYQAETQTALLARLQDPSISVLTALYSDPSIKLAFLDESYLDTITDLLNSATASPSRHLVLTHLTFVTQHFIPAHPGLATKAITECMWPFLVYNKLRQKTD